MEYVLDRRLQKSLAKLKQGKKVIDVAFECGFKTPSGFSKAIKKKYGKTPSQLRQEMESGGSLMKPNGIFIQSKVKQIKGFDVSGFFVEMDFSMENYSEKMIAYWNTFEEKNIEEKLYASINPCKHGEIGIIIREHDDDVKHKYLLGVMGRDNKEKTCWLNYHILGGKYIIITTAPVDMTVNDNVLSRMVQITWKYIFEQWFETVYYIYDEERDAFEFYDERCHYREDAVMDIYIPIKE